MSMISEENMSVAFEVPKVLYENRYCDQEGFSILVCGGKDKNDNFTNNVLELEIPSFKVNKFPSFVKPHCYAYLATIKSDIVCADYVYIDEKSLLSVQRYSDKNKTWTHRYVQMEERYDYCLSSFMSKLYFVGG